MFDEVVVHLTRPTCDAGEDGKMLFPWGLTFSRARLLLGCPKGVSAQSEKARSCIGMAVVKVGGALANDACGVTNAIAGRTEITLHFRSTKPKAGSERVRIY